MHCYNIIKELIEKNCIVMYRHYKYDLLILERQTRIQLRTSWDRLRPLSPFPSSICFGLGSPTVLYLLTQLKKQSVDRLQPALFFADAATEERKDIALRGGEREEREERVERVVEAWFANKYPCVPQNFRKRRRFNRRLANLDTAFAIASTLRP